MNRIGRNNYSVFDLSVQRELNELPLASASGLRCTSSEALAEMEN